MLGQHEAAQNTGCQPTGLRVAKQLFFQRRQEQASDQEGQCALVPQWRIRLRQAREDLQAIQVVAGGQQAQVQQLQRGVVPLAAGSERRVKGAPAALAAQAQHQPAGAFAGRKPISVSRYSKRGWKHLAEVLTNLYMRLKTLSSRLSYPCSNTHLRREPRRPATAATAGACAQRLADLQIEIAPQRGG